MRGKTNKGVDRAYTPPVQQPPWSVGFWPFVDTGCPEINLIAAVVHTAVIDVRTGKEREEAEQFIRNGWPRQLLGSTFDKLVTALEGWPA